MSFSVIDHYEGFEKNNFIKRDENQINLLHKLSLSWDQYNQNNLFFLKEKNLAFIFMEQLVQEKHLF